MATEVNHAILRMIPGIVKDANALKPMFSFNGGYGNVVF